MPQTLPGTGRRTTLTRVKKIYRAGFSRNGRRDVPRKRTQISEQEAGLPQRFALRLRQLMAHHGWSSKDVAGLLSAAGLNIGDRAVDSWLRGNSMPKAADLETVGTALGFIDYRDLLPPPTPKRRK